MESERNEDEFDEDEEEELPLIETRALQIDDVLSEKLEQAFYRQPSHFLLHDIAKIACEYDPIDLAYAVSRLPPHARIIVYENLPDLQAKISFMINTGNNTRAAIFKQLDDKEIKQLIENTPPDEAVWMLDDMSDRRLKRIMDIVDPKIASSIRELQQHDRHSAGRLMTNEFFAFHMNTTIGEVAAKIRDNPGIDLTRRIFVLNDNDELCGFVAARNLIISPHYIPLRQVMRPILHKVYADTSRDEVVDLVERYKIPALPVVDEDDKLEGVITYEDVVEALQDIADDTIASIAGTAEDISEHDPLIKRFFWRAPWLLVTLCAGLVTTTAMSHFYGRVWFTYLPLFVPLINGMSGNVGLQCSTILVRGMSTGELTPGSRRQVLTKELLMGLLIGCAFGLACALVVFVLNFLGIYQLGQDMFSVIAIVGCGVLGACLTATTLGVFSPFFFARFGVDPAVASGPIVTAFNDVLSTLMFFFIARTITYFFL